MIDFGIRSLGLGLLGLFVTLFWLLQSASGRVGSNAPTLPELGLAMLCFLSFSLGTAALAQGLALFSPVAGRASVDKRGGEEQTFDGEEWP